MLFSEFSIVVLSVRQIATFLGFVYLTALHSETVGVARKRSFKCDKNINVHEKKTRGGAAKCETTLSNLFYCIVTMQNDAFVPIIDLLPVQGVRHCPDFQK